MKGPESVARYGMVYLVAAHALMRGDDLVKPASRRRLHQKMFIGF